MNRWQVFAHHGVADDGTPPQSRRWISGLASLGVALGGALAAFTVTTVAAPPAMAADPFACDVVYALDGDSGNADNHATYSVDTETGDLTVELEMDIRSTRSATPWTGPVRPLTTG